MEALNDPEQTIAEIAARNYGVITYRELRSTGLGRQAIAYRVARGRLIELYPCVYAVGHARLTIEGKWLAATRAGGTGAVLSHGDAAALWALVPVAGTRIHVMTRHRSGRVPPAPVRLHRVGTLRGDEVTRHRGIGVTTVERTLLDLAPTVGARKLEDVIAQADRLGRFDLAGLRRVIDAHRRQPGRRKVMTLLDRLAGVGAADVRSAAERALLELCDGYGLPSPWVNPRVEGVLVDFHWPGTDLIVETDGFTYHSMPSAFEADRERDQLLLLAGYRVARFTYNQLTRERERSATRLRALLASCGSL
jgi:hypothetical protein